MAGIRRSLFDPDAIVAPAKPGMIAADTRSH
jgi:hypoxanthine phosphoribosyltransferase